MKTAPTLVLAGGSLTRGGHDPFEVRGCEELRDRQRAGHRADERVHRLVASRNGVEELLHVLRQVERGEVAGEVVARSGVWPGCGKVGACESDREQSHDIG